MALRGAEVNFFSALILLPIHCFHGRKKTGARILRMDAIIEGSHGVAVSTQDSESCDSSSNLDGTYFVAWRC